MTRIRAEQALLTTGWARDVAVTLDGARIARIEPDSAPRAGDIAVGALLPAPANLHSHAFQRAMAGMTERRGPSDSDSFWTWRQLMFRFLDQLTPEDVQAIAAFVQMEMLEAGYGASVEFHYLHHAPGGTPYADPAEMAARVVRAAQDSGIGLTLLPVLYQQGGCDGRALGPGQVRFGNTPDGFARLVEGAETALGALPDDARLGIAPHSLRAVTPEALALCTRLRPTAPLHMHLAEQTAEVDEVLAFLGARPVEWLLDHAAVDDRWCLIHCTQMQRPETLALAATRAVAGLCPITESSLGDGIFDGVAWTRAQGRFGIGSDSNIRITLSEELRTLDHSQRLRDRVRAALATPTQSTGRVLLQGAALGGAQAAGRDSGTLAEGRLADMLALDTGRVDLEGRTGDALLDAWIFAGDDRAVAEVWSAGRHLVRAGRHVARDRIETGYRAVVRRLQGGMMAITGWQAARDEALRRIRARDWPPGSRIPDEADLAAEWGVARATVNRALRDLADAGYLDRRRKGGTRVPVTPVRMATFAISIIRHDIEARGQVPGYRLLSDRIAPVPEALHAQLGAGAMRHVVALHTADGAPFCLEDRWLAPRIAEGIRFDTLSANEWLVGNVSFAEGTLAFHAIAADDALVRALACAPGAALLALDRETRDLAPITWVRLVYAPGYRMETGL